MRFCKYSSGRLPWQLHWLIALLFAWLSPAVAGTTALALDGRAAVPLWPAVTVLADPAARLDAAAALARAGDFAPPTGPVGNLGRATGAVWLRASVVLHGNEDVERILAFDYPSLNRIDVWQLRRGVAVAHHRLGNALRLSDRPLPTRTHAVALDFEPGVTELLVRVQSDSSLVLPITLRARDDFTAHESAAQMLLGLLTGVVLCMLVYSLAHGFSLRDGLFLQYALMLTGSLLFMLAYFGVGAQYLWPEMPAMSVQVAPLAVLLTTVAAAGFLSRTLRVRDISPPVDRVLRGAAAAALAAGLVSLLGWIDYRSAQIAAMALGLLTFFVALPVAYVRARRGDAVAGYILGGWAAYMVGAGALAALVHGWIEPTFWSQYLFSLSNMVEMAAWMVVLGMRVQTIHRGADRARLEGEALRALAHSDALTGLPNRRGLQQQLNQALALCGAHQLLAVYVIDLDGFKPVNDAHGHDVGDSLLVAVGQRLKSQLRGSDMVARLGGDEFVVLAGGLPDEAAARGIGQKMLAAFEAPFFARGVRCEIGLTIGYALAPLDGQTADELLRRADAAMYIGKQSGRRCMQRGGRSLVAT